MHYHSVWDQSSSSSSSVDSSTPINSWLPLKNGVTIGTEQDDMQYVRALLGGTNKDLLFIIYLPNHLDVLQLPSFKYLTKATLPFKLKEYGFSFVNMSTHMLLFSYKNDVLSITYDETKSTFRFQSFPVNCPSFQNLIGYSYLSFKELVVLFGG